MGLLSKSKCQEEENVATKEAGNNFLILKPWRLLMLKRQRKKNGEGSEEKKYQIVSQMTKMTLKKTVVLMKRLVVFHSKKNHLNQSQNQSLKMKNVKLRVPRDLLKLQIPIVFNKS